MQPASVTRCTGAGSKATPATPKTNEPTNWRTREEAARPEMGNSPPSTPLLVAEHLDDGGAKDDDERHLQEEDDHWHDEFRRQVGGLFLGFRHAHVAVILRSNAQRLADGGAVALGLDKGSGNRLDARDAGTLAQVFESL